MRLVTKTLLLILLLAITVQPALGQAGALAENAAPPEEVQLRVQAYELAQKHLIVDGHVDVPYRLYGGDGEDIARATAGGDFDYPRAKAGGLNAPFMSIYIPASYQEEAGAAKELADDLIDMVEGFVEQAPDKFAIATSTEDVRRHFQQDLISLPMGMENGAGLEGDLANLQHFYNRGIRYITLTHSQPNRISDASYDTEDRPHGGLSDFGREVIREMNRLGIMVDISHVSDEAFYDAIEVTQAPVIASHSSARHFTPGWERNMNDEMIRALADNGGVIMISFGSSFLRNEYQEEGGQIRSEINQTLSASWIDPDSPAGEAYFRAQRQLHPVGTVQDVADHIDHVVELVGIDHVGLGSDYDGVFALPEHLQDVSHYPNLVYELLQRGYSEEDIAKVLGGNAMRVWEEVEQTAQQLQAAR